MSHLDIQPNAECRAAGEAESHGLSTYRSFALKREGVRQVLLCANECITSLADIRERTSLGTVYVEAMPRFAKSAGLISADGMLSRFGTLAYENDPGLNDSRTQWLMHYHMAGPHRLGPTFWPTLFQFVLGRPRMTREDLVEFVRQLAGEGSEAGSRAVKYAVSAFTNTYTQEECLGHLGILTEDSGVLSVGEPVKPSPWVVAYALADYWMAQWGPVLGVNLSSMKEPGGLASLLMLSSGEMNTCLRDLQSLGLVQLQRKVPPFQVSRLWVSPDEILEHLYD